MGIITIIFVIILTIITLFLLIAVITRKEYCIKREIVINAPLQKTFDYLKHLKNQDHFNKWVMVDPGMQREFHGTDGTVGFVYVWNGNKQAGQGEQEIAAVEEGRTIKTEVRFIRPMPAVAYACYDFESLSDEQTKVVWTNNSAMKFPVNVMLPMIEKMLAKDMDISLSNLKNILEK